MARRTNVYDLIEQIRARPISEMSSQVAAQRTASSYNTRALAQQELRSHQNRKYLGASFWDGFRWSMDQPKQHRKGRPWSNAQVDRAMQKWMREFYRLHEEFDTCSPDEWKRALQASFIAGERYARSL